MKIGFGVKCYTKVEHIKQIYDNNRYNNLEITSCIKVIQCNSAISKFVSDLHQNK